jgi:hypothetical protein
LDALQNPASLDISLYTNNTYAGTEQRSFQTSDPFLVSLPSSFAGTRCYTDAATLPDNHTCGSTQAGLGVFIINTDDNPPISIFVKALLQESSSVFMAESAANTQTWNHHLLSTTLCDQTVHNIESTLIVPHTDNDILNNDILWWAPTKDGICTTKAAYSHLCSLQMHQLPNQGPRSISEQANKILHSIWKCKLIPPNIKTFAWRLRRALATAVRAGTFSIHIDMNCAYCGQQETDQHLFFTCIVPAQVWSTANPPFLTNYIPEEEDGVQLSFNFP